MKIISFEARLILEVTMILENKEDTNVGRKSSRSAGV